MAPVESPPPPRRSSPPGGAQDPPALPRQLGPYRILRRIGAGGMAEVHLARRYGASGWDKQVAIKVLRPEHRGRSDFERLLIGEARLGSRFNHPGLVSVHDLGLAGSIYYVCMDYVDGRDLSALMRRRRLPAPLALLVGEQLASALAYVHALTDEHGRSLGLVHRDVSPGNVLLSRSGAVKLSDFGIAKATAADATWGRLRMGKYAYMAPEQLTGGALTGAADLFALGVTLHECLLGRRPFDGHDPDDTMDAIRRAEFGPNHDFGGLDEELVAVLRSTLARDASRRMPGGAVGLARALNEARRRYPPVAMVDLGAWVRETLDGDPGASGVMVLETLGMDDEAS
ncbi:serine/threonine-protein kinase [Plesiocystis pacifica]|nr:serine/threonine-protein kinase [Plesiocystis pacifica]